MEKLLLKISQYLQENTRVGVSFQQSYKPKETPTQASSCEYCKIFKNTSFEEHLQTAASDETFIITS